jgi:hypothetical protein
MLTVVVVVTPLFYQRCGRGFEVYGVLLVLRHGCAV